MPAKINMFLSNGNLKPSQIRSIVNKANLSSVSPAAPKAVPKASTALNSSIIGRIHNAKAGCGSCGRH